MRSGGDRRWVQPRDVGSDVIERKLQEDILGNCPSHSMCDKKKDWLWLSVGDAVTFGQNKILWGVKCPSAPHFCCTSTIFNHFFHCIDKAKYYKIKS